jgi:hypothetical protein
MMGIEKVHQELMGTLGDDADGLSQIKIWLQRFRTGDLSCNDLPRAGRPLLTLGPSVVAFVQKHPFANARKIAKHFLTTPYAVKEMLQRELGMRKFSRRWVSHSLSDAQKAACLEAAKETLMILQESETNDFDSIATGDEPWLQHITASLKMFARSAANIPFRGRGRQLVQTNYDHAFLHCKETYRVRCFSKR